MDLRRKLHVLADAAKYDASCASSGTDKRSSVGGRGIGSTEGAVIGGTAGAIIGDDDRRK